MLEFCRCGHGRLAHGHGGPGCWGRVLTAGAAGSGGAGGGAGEPVTPLAGSLSGECSWPWPPPPCPMVTRCSARRVGAEGRWACLVPLLPDGRSCWRSRRSGRAQVLAAADGVASVGRASASRHVMRNVSSGWHHGWGGRRSTRCRRWPCCGGRGPGESPAADRLFRPAARDCPSAHGESQRRRRRFRWRRNG